MSSLRDRYVHPLQVAAKAIRVTTETATKRDGDCTGSLPSGTWNADTIGYLSVAESYQGTIEVEYLAR